MPEQPLLRTPMRMPTVGFSRPPINAFTFSAASGVTLITAGRGRRTRGAAAGFGAAATSVVVAVATAVVVAVATAVVVAVATAVVVSVDVLILVTPRPRPS